MTEEKSRFQPIAALKQITVEPYLFFCLFGFSSRLVTIQNLLIDRSCRNTLGYDAATCNSLVGHPEARASSIEMANNFFIGIMLMASVPSIVVVIFMGPWSDRYGRKYPLIIGASGMLAESVISSILTAVPTAPPYWFVVATLFCGLTGDFLMVQSTAFSYISDITDERSRPTRYAVLQFFIILANVTAFQAGGHLHDNFGDLAVMVASPCAFVCAILWVVFFVKETKIKAADVKMSQVFRDLVRLDNMKESYRTFSQRRPGNLRLQIWLLMFVGCCVKLVELGLLSITYPFVKTMYDWSVIKSSNVLTVVYVFQAVATLTLVPVLSKKMRMHEAAVGLVGILSYMTEMVVRSVAFQESVYYYACLSGCLYQFSEVAVRSRLSKLVNKEELGKVFAILTICGALMPLLGSLSFGQIFNASQRTYPAMPFAIAAIFLLPSAYIFGWMMKMPTLSLAQYTEQEIMRQTRPMKTLSFNYETLHEDPSSKHEVY